MVAVPELLCADVRDAGQGAAAGRGPVRGENRLPNDQNAELAVRVFLQ